MARELRIEPHWLDSSDAYAIHNRQLAEHGGSSGVRDPSLLEPALARPLNQWNYGTDDPADLAAAYAYGVARNHPFFDGNKRTAWVLARLFLALDNHFFAAGELTEKGMAAWFRKHQA